MRLINGTAHGAAPGGGERRKASVLYRDVSIQCGFFFHTQEKKCRNAGVILLNVANLRAVHDQFMAFMTNPSNMEMDLPLLRFRYKGGGPLDQGALRGFFGNKTEFLPWKYNWKAFWEYNSNHHILHFHGKKPAQYRDFSQKKKEHYTIIEEWCKVANGCAKHLSIFDTWLEKVKRYKT